MKLLKTIFFAFAVILFFSGSDKAFSSDKISKILILPFNLRSQKDLSFLQKGIEEMLSTRLAFENNVIISEKEDGGQALEKSSDRIDEKSALALSKKADADYVLFGSLTISGESISTDAKFYDVHTKMPLVEFSKTGNTPGDVINEIDELAGKINKNVFGRKTSFNTASLPASKQINVEKMPVKEPATDNHRNPEELWKEENKKNKK